MEPGTVVDAGMWGAEAELTATASSTGVGKEMLTIS
jgi:hypothetical protein